MVVRGARVGATRALGDGGRSDGVAVALGAQAAVEQGQAGQVAHGAGTAVVLQADMPQQGGDAEDVAALERAARAGADDEAARARGADDGLAVDNEAAARGHVAQGVGVDELDLEAGAHTAAHGLVLEQRGQALAVVEGEQVDVEAAGGEREAALGDGQRGDDVEGGGDAGEGLAARGVVDDEREAGVEAQAGGSADVGERGEVDGVELVTSLGEAGAVGDGEVERDVRVAERVQRGERALELVEVLRAGLGVVRLLGPWHVQVHQHCRHYGNGWRWKNVLMLASYGDGFLWLSTKNCPAANVFGDRRGCTGGIRAGGGWAGSGGRPGIYTSIHYTYITHVCGHVYA